MTLLAVVGAPVSFSQEVAPGTPTELRDFKLDPDKPEAAPKPLPAAEPTTQPRAQSLPKAPASISETPAPTSSLPGTRSLPNPPAAQNKTASQRAKPPEIPNSSATLKSAAKKDTGALTNAAPPSAQDVAPDVTPVNEPSLAGPDATIMQPDPALRPMDSAPVRSLLMREIPLGWIASGLAALVVLIGAGFMLRRRKNSFPARDQETYDVKIKSSEILAPAGKPITTASESEPACKLPATSSKMPSKLQQSVRPDLNISFVPEKATVGLVNLTIKGQLHIINNGSADANAMYLDAGVISASENQDRLMTDFFAAQTLLDKDLGGVKIGERIGLEMDLQIPLNELPAYLLGDQKMLVPIILARVVYHWGAKKEQDEARLSCLIGREASPPKPKMGPLRLDMGPRSFAHLGQRSVLA